MLQMGKKNITFGDREKHTIDISWSDWTGVVTIKIDNQRKNDLFFQDLIPSVPRSFDYTIGTNEVHSVHVEIGYGAYTPSTTVYLDGSMIE